MTKNMKRIGKHYAAGTMMAIKGSIYVAGPINGNSDYKIAFRSATAMLRGEGWTVYSPAELDTTDMSNREMYAIELGWITRQATAIYMLKGWENSVGAQAEWAVARALGLRIYYE